MQYSNDLRQKLVEAWQAGHGTQAELAEWFGVSLRWVEKVLRRWRKTGQTAARPFRHGPLPLLRPARLERVVQQRPAATLAELGRRLKVSASTVHRALARLDLPRKKRPSTPANATRLVSSGYGRVGGRRAVIWTRVN
jgi:transposase